MAFKIFVSCSTRDLSTVTVFQSHASDVVDVMGVDFNHAAPRTPLESP